MTTLRKHALQLQLPRQEGHAVLICSLVCSGYLAHKSDRIPSGNHYLLGSITTLKRTRLFLLPKIPKGTKKGFIYTAILPPKEKIKKTLQICASDFWCRNFLQEVLGKSISLRILRSSEEGSDSPPSLYHGTERKLSIPQVWSPHPWIFTDKYTTDPASCRIQGGFQKCPKAKNFQNIAF